MSICLKLIEGGSQGAQLGLPRWIAALMIDQIASIEANDMIREAPAMTVRQNLGKLLNETRYRGDSVVIAKSGKPVAALIESPTQFARRL